MKNIIFTFFSIIANYVFTQNIHATSITLLPENPTASSDITIITSAFTSSLGETIGIEYRRNGSSLQIIGCYFGGVASQPNSNIDSTIIGTLAQGNYHLTYIANMTYANSCDQSIVDSDTIEMDFTVGEVAVNELETQPVIVQLFPNPVSDFQIINIIGTTKEKIYVELLDMQGRKIRQLFSGYSSSPKTVIEANLENLSPSIYNYRIQIGNTQQLIRFIKQ